MIFECSLGICAGPNAGEQVLEVGIQHNDSDDRWHWGWDEIEDFEVEMGIKLKILRLNDKSIVDLMVKMGWHCIS